MFLLQGALLLVLFQCSHAIEHMLTDRAHGNLSALMESCPETATVVDLTPEGEPAMESAREVAASQVAVGGSILVKPGQQVRIPLPSPPGCTPWNEAFQPLRLDLTVTFPHVLRNRLQHANTTTVCCTVRVPPLNALGKLEIRERVRRRQLLQSTHISWWEHSSHDSLIGRGVPGVSSVPRQCTNFLFGLPQGKIPRSPYDAYVSSQAHPAA